jgi:PAS domain S-box-containing protein
MNKKTGKSGTSQQNNILGKRDKELRCLCDVASITHAPPITLRETAHRVAAILPAGFSHPESVRVRVRLNGEELTRGDGRQSISKISSAIVVRGEPAGTIEVSYPAGKAADEAAFSSEERLLLDTVAESLGALMANRQAEEALRLSEEKFYKAFHASPNMVSITTMDEGRFIDVNNRYIELTGYSREEVIGRCTTEVGIWKTPADRERMIERLDNHGRVNNMEVSWSNKSGDTHIGRLSAEIIHIGGQRCIFAITSDITRQKESQELLQTVFLSSPFGIFIARDGVIIHTNPQFQKITGYSQPELRGRELLSLVAPEDTDVVTSSILFTLQEKTPYPCEYRVLGKTGQLKWVVQTVSPIHWRGEAILGNIMDISELKYLERKVVEYEELSKMKGDLLATVSHELRTPLATIKGYATMILDYFARLGAEETKDYLRAIDSSTDRLSKLVDNLLDTSRLEAGLLKLQKAPAGIAPLIRKLVEEAGVRNTGHNITTRLGNRLPRVNIDSRRIGQVLDNLIDNAVKYSPAGTEITISAQRNGADLLVSVSDEGPGIPAGELQHIFERMYRIEKRLDSGAGGIGLGLYICQRLVEAHGGMIWAESTLGRGTTIKFTLPAAARVKRTGRLVPSRR